MIIDSHCHLNYEPMSLSLKETIDKIKDANILNNEKEIGNLEILFTKIEDDN